MRAVEIAAMVTIAVPAIGVTAGTTSRVTKKTTAMKHGTATAGTAEITGREGNTEIQGGSK